MNEIVKYKQQGNLKPESIDGICHCQEIHKNEIKNNIHILCGGIIENGTKKILR